MTTKAQTDSGAEVSISERPSDIYTDLPEHCWRRQSPPFDSYYERGEWRSKRPVSSLGPPSFLVTDPDGNTEHHRVSSNEAEFEGPTLNHTRANSGVSATSFAEDKGDGYCKPLPSKQRQKFKRLGPLNRGSDNRATADTEKQDGVIKVNWKKRRWLEEADRFLRQLPINRAQRERVLWCLDNLSLRCFNAHHCGKRGAVIGFLGLEIGIDHLAFETNLVKAWCEEHDIDAEKTVVFTESRNWR